MRFIEEEKLAIIKERQKTGAKAVCAKYDISEWSYRLWRYKAQGIKSRKHFSLNEKLKILEEGARDGVCRTCAAYYINPTTYYSSSDGFDVLAQLDIEMGKTLISFNLAMNPSAKKDQHL